MTIKFFVSAKKRDLVPIYVRLSAGRGTDLIVKSGLFVKPGRWSNTTQTIKQRIRTDDDETLVNKLNILRGYIDKEFKLNSVVKSKEWLQSAVDKFHNKKSTDAKNLNDYVEVFIQDIKNGDRKTKSALNYSQGTIISFVNLQIALNEYQGIYSARRLKKIERQNKRLKEEEKPDKKLRPLKKLDFSDINIDFYNSFIKFLSDEGYALNTQGRQIKALKVIMKKSYQEKLHNNQEFGYDAFKGIKEESFAIALTQDELDRLYNLDLYQSGNRWLKLARDAWFFLYETCLRVSDYDKIEVNIRTLEGRKIIDIFQTKTRKRVLIPLTARFEELWEKYQHTIPRISDQMINKYIRIAAKLAGINRLVHWRVVKYGKSYDKYAEAYEKITCHTARRTGATVLWKEGVPLSDIMILLGHATEKQTREYIKITAEEAVLRLANHPHYSNHLTMVKAG
jgi:site-specific recombinase XerD